MVISDERLALVRSLNVMDDAFFQKVAEDPRACEEILRVVLQDPGLVVEEVQTQEFVRNVGARSVVIDALCLLGDGTRAAVEMQKRDDADHVRRVRYVRSNVDTVLSEQGTPYAELPTIVVVFMSSFDLFGAGFTTYHVDKVVRETGVRLDDGTLDVYVNSSVDDGSKTARLMGYLAKSEGANEEFPAVSGRVAYFKETNEGRACMSDMIEAYARECAEEAAREAAREAAATSMLGAVRALMETMAFSAAEALEKLKVPEDQRADYLALLSC